MGPGSVTATDAPAVGSGRSVCDRMWSRGAYGLFVPELHDIRQRILHCIGVVRAHQPFDVPLRTGPQRWCRVSTLLHCYVSNTCACLNRGSTRVAERVRDGIENAHLLRLVLWAARGGNQEHSAG